MNDLTNAEVRESGTNLRNFMARRGAVIVKESRPSGSVDGMYQNFLEVGTMILTIVKNQKRQTLYGVTLKHVDRNKSIETSAHLDFDEIDELTGALDFIKQTSLDLLGTQRDYTEVMYTTKDDAQFGFFQSIDSQTAFLSLSRRSTMFINLDAIDQVKHTLSVAQNHLISCGAQIVVG